MTLIIPRVNLNGDNDVREKLDLAIRALQAASYANGRNYQLNPAGEGRAAYEQHSERVQILERIAHELLEIQYDISTQG